MTEGQECLERLKAYFLEEGVPYELHEHPVAYTAQEVAAAEHVSGYELAKVVVVRAGARLVLTVVPAPHRVDLDKVAELLGVEEAELAREEEFASLFPDCEAGAMPPLGNLYGVDVWVDRALSERPRITFTGCDHRHTFRIDYQNFQRLAEPRLGEFGIPPGEEG